MSTRGFVGKKKSGHITGYFNHWDSYYDQLGKEAVEAYFAGRDIYSILNKQSHTERDDSFITNGLFCEYAYVYNEDNDTLEIYRGFFKTPQWTKQGYASGDKNYYTHWIFTVDKKKHTKEQVFKAFKAYDESDKDGMGAQNKYPERRIMNATPVGKRHVGKGWHKQKRRHKIAAKVGHVKKRRKVSYASLGRHRLGRLHSRWRKVSDR